ncbi:hypothetical protein Q8A67_021246 [Cirrhinus molitorella]|uniref:Uncharacterized protein n=1 Tax=Cirrhinus molitorella TaxID=172907 RepID=A0AA88TML2_9TELE|nr:hypothetical protein Q8A67_021246 [Cirrhinus molitorella]
MLLCETEMAECPGCLNCERSLQQGELLSCSLSTPHLAPEACPGKAPHHPSPTQTIQHGTAIRSVMRDLNHRWLQGTVGHLIFHLIHFFLETRVDSLARGDVWWSHIVPRFFVCDAECLRGFIESLLRVASHRTALICQLSALEGSQNTHK